jgi:hypothetical protein
MDRSSIEEELLGEGGLPRVGVTDDGEGAARLDRCRDGWVCKHGEKCSPEAKGELVGWIVGW